MIGQMAFADNPSKPGDCRFQPSIASAQNRFTITKQMGETTLNAYEGFDNQEQHKIMLIEVPEPVDDDKHVAPDPGAHSSEGSSTACLLRPYAIAEVNDRFFAVISIPKGMTLQQNIDMMRNLLQPFQEEEIARIGKLLCTIATCAETCGLITLIHKELVIVTTDGSIRVAALRRNQITDGIAKTFSNLQSAIASLLLDMASSGQSSAQGEKSLRPLRISPQLRKILHKALSNDKRINSLNTFADALSQEMRTKSKKWKRAMRSCIGIVLLVASLMLFNVHKPSFSPEDSASSEIRLAVDDARATARAAAKEWTILVSSKRIAIPPQALDAKYIMEKGDEFSAIANLEKAKQAYVQATVLYEAAVAAGKEIVAYRSKAENARELSRLAQSRWVPLLGSSYVQIPDAPARADDTMLEGDFQYLQQHYQEAAIAYELAEQLYDSVSPDKFKILLQRHQAATARDQARISAAAWERLEGSVGQLASESANKAKELMAAGEGFIQAGQDVAAARSFEDAAKLFDAAAKIAVAEMVAQVGAANAYERAIEAKNRWDALFQVTKRQNTPEDIVTAKSLLEEGHNLVNQGKHEQAQKNYERSSALYEYQIEQLNAEARTQAQAYENRTQVMLTSISESQESLEARWSDTRQDFENIHKQLSQPNDPNQREQLLIESKNIRKNYRLITNLRSYCAKNVYSGAFYEKAEEMLIRGQDLVTRGEYVAASVVLDSAATEFSKLAELPLEVENYLVQEELVSTAKENALEALGPLAKELPEIKRLLDLADESISDANKLFQMRDIPNAIQSLTDAELTLNSIRPQAEIELLNYARVCDSEMRTEIALAALKELIEINPGHIEALKLVQKLQSSDRSGNRITFIQGKLRINGKPIPSRPSTQKLSAILGDLPRQRTVQSVLIFDELGILATPDPTTNKILNLVIYYTKPQQVNEPRNFYPGIIEIEGQAIGRDDPIEKINASLKDINFKPTRIGSSFEAIHLGLRLLINYQLRTNQIYSISVMFMSDLSN